MRSWFWGLAEARSISQRTSCSSLLACPLSVCARCCAVLQVSGLDEYHLNDLYEQSRHQRPSTLVSPRSPQTASTANAMPSDAQAPSQADNGSAASSRDTAQPTGALARLVLSPGSSSNVPAAQVLSPTTLLHQIHHGRHAQ